MPDESSDAFFAKIRTTPQPQQAQPTQPIQPVVQPQVFAQLKPTPPPAALNLLPYIVVAVVVVGAVVGGVAYLNSRGNNRLSDDGLLFGSGKGLPPAGGETPTPTPAQTGQRCMPSMTPVRMGEESQSCTDNHKGMGITLEQVQSGVTCDPSAYIDEPLTRAVITARSYYDYYAFYPEWGATITDDNGNTYLAWNVQCKNDLANPSAPERTWVRLGDAAYTPCTQNCVRHGAVYFTALKPAREYNMTILGFSFTFSPAQVEWVR